MHNRLLLLALAAVLLAGAAAAPAHADEIVADDLTRDTPIAARSGVVAWSRWDAASQRFRLVLQGPDGRADAPIPGSRRAFDVSMGSDRRGRTVVLYSRCTSGERGCDVYRFDFATGREQKVDAVSGPTEDEAWPVQEGDLLAFARRRRGVGRREVRDCDLVFVKRLSSRAPSKRLDRGSCGLTTGMAMRGSRIAQVTFGSPPSATRFASQVRLLSTRGGAVRVLAQQGSGEESNAFASPSLSANSVWLTRSGVGTTEKFVRLDIASRRLTEVPARVGLSGPMARDERGALWYVQTPGSSDLDCTAAGSAPCRLIRATPSPFSGSERSLAPALTITAPSDRGLPPVVFGDQFVVGGRLARIVVRRGDVLRADPIANTVVRLLRRVDDPSAPGPLREVFVPTTLTTVTSAEGWWAIALAAPPARPWFSAVTEGPFKRTFAGRGTVGAVEARVTLTADRGLFGGTVTPAQPGRTVKIQRLVRRSCQTTQSGQRFCNDVWATVADAPLNAAGTHFAAAVPAAPAGSYTAALPFADQQADPQAYGGRSPEVAVGG